MCLLLHRLIVSMSILVVFTFSMAVQEHLNQLWYHEINHLINRYLLITKPQSRIHLIIDRKVNSVIFEHILNGYRKSNPIILSDSNNKITQCKILTCQKMHFIVGVFKTPQDVRADKWKEFYNHAWNPAASIAIWISDPVNLDDIKKLLETFWQHNSIDVIAITFDILKNTTIVYSYNPFVIKNNNNRGEIFQVSSSDNLYSDKLENLYGYPIRISLYEHQPHVSLKNFTALADGRDVNYCKALSKWMNFTVDLKTASDDFSSYIINLTNGTNYSAKGDVITNRSDFIGNSLHWESNDLVEIEYVYPRWRSRIVIMVPRNKALPGIFKLFKSGSGITIALTFSALCLLFIILTIKGDRNALIKTFSLMLFQTFGKIGFNNSERIFCIAWIYWSLVLVSIFQGKLIHDIAAPPYHNDINSLGAFYKSNLTLMTKRWEHDILNNSYVSKIKRLSERAIIDKNETRCMIKMMTHKNVACTVEGSHADYKIAEMRRAIYKKRLLHKKIIISREIHIMQQPLFYYWRTYIVKKDFVYLKKMNKLALRFVEFGIMKKWVNDDLGKNLQMTYTESNAEPLDLATVHNIFFILICGYIMAIIVFLIEITCHNIKYKQSKRNKI